MIYITATRSQFTLLLGGNNRTRTCDLAHDCSMAALPTELYPHIALCSFLIYG